MRLKANGSAFNEVISGLSFTIRWVDTSPATLGIVTSTWCPAPSAAFSLSPSAMVTPGNGFKYRTYQSFGTEQIGFIQDNGGCGDGQTLPADTWVTVGTINVSNNTGCTEFQIVNDGFTAANNRNFFAALNGVQGLAGSIEPTSVLRGNCTVDCNGDIGGTAAIDLCGVCAGGNTGVTPNTSCLDCNGVINGTAFIDNCGDCVGGNTGEVACVQDCNGDFGGTAVIDNCGNCVGGNTGEVACVQDCNGDFGGTAAIDLCGVCAGGNTGVTPNTSCLDCNGVINGTAFIDNCGDCVGGNTGEVACVQDCNGDFGGTAVIDNCGNCVGGNTGEVACLQDCNGDFGGTAVIDNCGNCVGGNTGEVACVQDCNGDFGGTAVIDNCGNCVGGNTGEVACVQDCNGDFGGTAVIDNCGNCVGGNTGEVACAADCNGDFGGTAVIDNCGNCVGGNTGEVACVQDCNGDFGGTAAIDLCGVCAGGNTGVTPNTSCLDCEGVPNGPATAGTPCDDQNIATEGDMWTLDCECVGTPVGGCDYPVNLVLQTDGNASETFWEIVVQGTETVVCEGTDYTGADNTFIGEQCCLAAGCYDLRVYDSAGDGMSTGGYVLSMQNGDRIIDNAGNGGFGSVSTIANGLGFCVPMGVDRLITSSCDKEFWLNNEYIVADGNPLVSAQYGISNATSGYQMWWFDPNGGYSFRRYQSHSTSNGMAASPTRACHFRINSWSGNQLQQGVLYNVRVRGRVNGVFLEFGPACRFRLDATLAQCPPTQLVNSTALPEFSCGVTRQFPSSQKIWAWSRPGANRYQFEFSLPAEGFSGTRTSTTNWIAMNWTGPSALENGRTYTVRVRISKNGGATWCEWGAPCSVTIDNGLAQISAGGQRDLSESLIEAPAMTVYPNPNRGDQVMVNVSGLDNSTATIELYDLLGNRVRTLVMPVVDGRIAQPIELGGDLSDGVYMLSLSDGKASFTQRLMIQR
ncbi:MAG: T9SS type A sorting domain-containing protein [Flavobacteriales bacterium]|nr:T9SS type A sorting domain-containing protein [Flavobacteriales bacterium]